MIVARVSSQLIKDKLREQGNAFLKDNLVDLVREGMTTLAELMKVVYFMD